MSHDIYAAWAAAELASHFRSNPSDCFEDITQGDELSVFASREGRNEWPMADGVIKIERGSRSYNLALEFKKVNEGLHGILTALGQSLAYLKKGYSGSVIVVPERYETFERPGEYVRDVLDQNTSNHFVSVFGYDEPDTSIASPFQNRLFCHRRINICGRTAASNLISSQARSSGGTQWAHLREGSSDPGAFFLYLQVAKVLAVNDYQEPDVSLNEALIGAVYRLDQRCSGREDALKYLANARGDSFHDRVWRHFWFKYVLNEDTLPIWNIDNGVYEVNDSFSMIQRSDGNGMKRFFCGRSDSIKNKLVDTLNRQEIMEEEAWEEYARNIHGRAHSYREDIDSGLEHLGLIEYDGRPSDLGYRFVDSCERTGDPNRGTPKSILGKAILKNGQLAAFLHYIHKLSESIFRENANSFVVAEAGSSRFDEEAYLQWLREQLANRLSVMNTASRRGGAQRRPFQAEFAILRNYGFIRGMRMGVGLEVNWPAVQEALDFSF